MKDDTSEYSSYLQFAYWWLVTYTFNVIMWFL